MYVQMVLKDRQGNLHEVKVKNGCKIVNPKSFWEQLQYGVATNDLLGKFTLKFRKFANENYALVEVHTDNALLAKKLMDEGYNVVFDPYPEEEMVKSEP